VLAPQGDDPLGGDYVAGTDLSARRVAADGTESAVNATGRLAVHREGSQYVIDAQLELEGTPVRARGRLRNALWVVGEGS